MNLQIKRQIERFASISPLSRNHQALKAATKELENKILIGTHHKTGTVWMKNIFSQIGRKFKLKFVNDKFENIPQEFNIFLQDHSQFDFDRLKIEYKGLHIIRDPRDIIISGCFYHQKSHEPWLHLKREELGGLTYQEKINSYESLDDKILFELDNSEYNLVPIINWDYYNPAFFEVKYEDLIVDTDLLLFHEIFAFLGFSGKVMPEILKIAYDNSIFSGNLKESIHVRSAQKKQWEKYFKPQHKTRFLEMYGDALIKLGYENNNDWAND